jgi:hypothetical protein
MWKSDLSTARSSSTNGVFLREPGQQAWTRLAPWHPTSWRPEASVQVGGRTLRLQALPTQTPPRHPRVNLHHDMPAPRNSGRLAGQPLRNGVAPRRFRVAGEGHAPNVGHAVAQPVRPLALPN